MSRARSIYFLPSWRGNCVITFGAHKASDARGIIYTLWLRLRHYFSSFRLFIRWFTRKSHSAGKLPIISSLFSSLFSLLLSHSIWCARCVNWNGVIMLQTCFVKRFNKCLLSKQKCPLMKKEINLYVSEQIKLLLFTDIKDYYGIIIARHGTLKK